MQNERRTRTFRVIFKIFQFVSRMCDDHAKGDYSETNEYEEVALPAALKSIIRTKSLELMSQDFDPSVEEMIQSPDRQQLLKEKYRYVFEQKIDTMNDEFFISFIVFCCFTAKHCKDGGFPDAPIVAASVVNEMCENSQRYSALTSLGCDI